MKRTEVISADKSLPSHQERPFPNVCPPLSRYAPPIPPAKKESLDKHRSIVQILAHDR
jgi:hypothetical protein